MTSHQEYIAVLRCQTWNIWPDRYLEEDREFEVDYGEEHPISARLVVLSYDTRSSPEKFSPESTSLGMLLWDGETPGLHRVRDTVLKAPEDTVELVWQHRNAYRGEIDICINFIYVGDITPALHEALRAAANAFMSLMNLQLHDFLVPAVPFQIHKALPGGGVGIESTLIMAVRNRQTITRDKMQETIAHLTRAIKHSIFGPRFVTALELYAAHFTEPQTRVRFLLLVVAIESLATKTKKHAVAVDMIRRWEIDLEAEMKRHVISSEIWQSLDALRREICFRVDDSVRSQVRKLFAGLPGYTVEESLSLQNKALRVYDKRSALVHDGYLPSMELMGLEEDARDLLEKIFRSVTEMRVDEE